MSSKSDTLEAFARLLKQQESGLKGGVKALLSTITPERGEIVRATAIPRRFDQTLLPVLVPRLAHDDPARWIEDLNRFAFISTTGDSYVVHDEARSFLLHEWMQQQSITRFREINARLRDFFEPPSASTPIHDLGEPGIDFVLHSIGADTDTGFELFQSALISARKVYARATERALLQAINDFFPLLSARQRLWVDYFRALTQIERRDLKKALTTLQTVAGCGKADPKLNALAEMRMGEIAYLSREFDEAERHLKCVITISQSTEERWPDVLHPTLIAEANICRETNRAADAEQLIQEGIGLATHSGDPAMIARSYNAQGNLRRKLGDAKPAIDSFQQAISALESAALSFPQSRILNNMALAYADCADWEAAQAHLQKSLAVERKAGDSLAQAQVLANMSRVHWATGQSEKGVAVAQEAIDLMLRVHARFDAAEVKHALAKHMVRQKKPGEANKYYTEAAVLFESSGSADKAKRVEEECRKAMAKRLPKGLTFLFTALASVAALAILAGAFYYVATHLIRPLFKPDEAVLLQPGEEDEFGIGADFVAVPYKIVVVEKVQTILISLSEAESDLDLYAGQGRFDHPDNARWLGLTESHDEQLLIPWKESDASGPRELFIHIYNSGTEPTRARIKVIFTQ